MKLYCQIKENDVSINGSKVDFERLDDQDWKKNLYKQLDLRYPKFYKMDCLSKMVILGMKMIEREGGLDEYGDSDLSMIFSNSQSSTDNDLKYLDSSNSGMPSPSIFVYTLPSVCVGELTIFKKYYGPSCFYLTNDISSLPLKDLVEIELSKGYKGVLFCWVEKSYDRDFGLFFKFDKSPTEEDLALIKRSIN